MPQAPDSLIEAHSVPENTGLYYTEEPPRKKAIPQKPSARSRKRNEAGGEHTHKEKTAKTVSKDV